MKFILIAVLGIFALIGLGSLFSTAKAVTSPNACYHVTNGSVDPVPFAFIPPHTQSCPPIPNWVHENIDSVKKHPEDWDATTNTPPSVPASHNCDVIIMDAPQ